MAKRNGIDEGSLSAGHLRKLNALRKSVGDALGEEAFAKWYAQQEDGTDDDPNAEALARIIWRAIEKEGLQITRKGYIVRRGRGRVIVEPIEEILRD